MNDYKTHLSEAAAANVEAWLSEPKYDDYREELEGMIQAGEWQALEDAFFKKIEFGTGGIRGKTGLGSNRINKVTMGEAAQALCQYVLQHDPNAGEKGIAIVRDTRLSGEEFMRYVAGVCAAHGFKTYVYDNFRATPQLSFTVRNMGLAAGIVISASHNPPADNGFKAYWSDGGQLVAPHDKAVVEMGNAVTEIKVVDYDKAMAEGRIEVLGKKHDDAYIQAVVNEAVGTARDLSIVYSPLHGAGQTNVLPVLRKAGFENISLVEAQMDPDGNFPTVKGGKPNPEEPGANDMAIEQLQAEQADIAMTNDPDADRIGVMVRHESEVTSLTGNQIFALATDYVLRKRQEKGKLQPTDYIIETIVTTDMVKALTDHYGCVTYDQLPVGIKFIAELMTKKEGGGETFLIGGEESYGITLGDYIREKDGAAGALVAAEHAAELKAEGKTLLDRLYELFAQHGVFVERLDSVYCEGADGFKVMQDAMARLRTLPPAEIGGQRVTAVRDHAARTEKNMETDEEIPLECISANVIALIFNGDSRCRITVRPSGTEPKIKFYVQWYEPANDDVKAQYKQLQSFIQQLSGEMEKVVLNAS